MSGTGARRGSSLPEINSTPRRAPARRTPAEKRDDCGSGRMVTSFLTPSPVMTSPSTSRCSAAGKPPRSTSRRVGFCFDEAATSPRCVDASGHTRRPTDLDVVAAPARPTCNDGQRQATSMVVVGEKNVDEMFQPVSINGDNFALLQMSARLSYPLGLYILTFHVQTYSVCFFRSHFCTYRLLVFNSVC